MNTNFKLELFNFKQGLSMDELELDRVITQHLVSADSFSEKELVKSLKEKLDPYTYSKDVKVLLEKMEEELVAQPLVYELKDLYKKIERKDHGLLYRDALHKLLDIINMDTDEMRMEKILNEFTIYDWIPEAKQFLLNLHKSPIERQNLKNSGKGEMVYSIVEKVEDGHMCYVANRWFHLGENDVTMSLLEDHIKDENRIKVLRTLEQAVNLSEISEDVVTFPVDGSLSLGVSTKDGSLYVNGKKSEDESTLESIFNSPIIPFLKKEYYPLVLSVKENIDKFVELDVCVKTSNLLKPFLESYTFNYKDKMYLYNVDKRVGNSFYEYESVTSLISDIQKELDYDITYFFENKLSKELKHFKALEEREQKIELKIKEINESIDELKMETDLLETDKDMKMAFDNLLIYKHNLVKELDKVKSEKSDAKKLMIKIK